jgi:GGDEF domain-containing protein
MNRRVLIIYYIISVAFLLAITGLGAYRITRRAEANLRASRRDLEALRITALSTYLASGGFDTDFFRSSMRDNFRRTPRLRLVALYSREGGLYYLLSANPELVGPEEPGGPAGSGGQERLPGSPSGWGGAPSYRLRPLVHVRLSVPFSLGRRSDAVPPPGLVLDAVFLRLDREDLYPILRELFFVLLVYLAITTLLLLIAALSPPASGAARPAAPRPRRGRLALPDGDPASASDSSSSAESRQSGLYSPDTGLGWRDFLAERLNQELERAASFDQDLALLLLGVKPRAAAGPPERRRYLYRRLSQHTLESFLLRDLDFEYDQHTVAVILPERSLNRALEEAQGFQRKLLQAPWGGAGSVRVYAGLSSRSGRLISGTRLLVEASRALKRADAAGNNQIIAFRADPQKYRQVLFSGRG